MDTFLIRELKFRRARKRNGKVMDRGVLESWLVDLDIFAACLFSS